MNRLFIEIFVHYEVGVADNRVCGWAWRNVFFARSKAHEGVGDVYTSQSHNGPEIWEGLE